MAKNPLENPKTTKTGEMKPPENPEDLQCNLCTGGGAWKGPLCKSCPAERQKHYTEGMGAHIADFFCVAESPYLAGPSGDTESHKSWNFDVEKLVKEAFVKQREKHNATLRLEGRYTFAVRCAEDKPNKKMKDCCFPLFSKDLLEHATTTRPIMIFALGPVVLQSLGIKVSKYQDAQGKFHRATIDGRDVVVFASLSKRQIPTKTGYFDILRQHIDIFLQAVVHAEKEDDTENINPALSLQKLKKEYIFPSTVDEVRQVVEDIILYATPGKNPDHHVIGIDTETNTLYPHRKKLKLLNILVSWGPGKAAAIPVEHSECTWTLEEVFPYIQQLLGCDKPKVFQNGKFDLKVLWARGFKVNRFVWDTMIGEHLLAEDKRGYYGLKALTKTYLPEYSGYEDELMEIRKKLAQEQEEASGTKGSKSNLKGAAKKLANDDGFAMVPLKPLNEYGAVDADVTRRMCIIQRGRIARENATIAKKRRKLGRNKHFRKSAQPGSKEACPLSHIMFRRAIPATKTLATMEAYGMRVDLEYVDELAKKMDSAIIKSSTAMHLMIPPGTFSEGFNPNSTAHLRTLLFITGYLPAPGLKHVNYTGKIPDELVRKTETGLTSTDAAFLKMLKSQYECKFATVLLDYRAVYKARNTFVENIRVLSEEDGRMHTTFHITGTATGRLSSSDENMQNVPKRIGQHNIKKIFIPTDTENQVIVNADAKAAEVRLYAAYSGDKNLIKALRDGMDPHSFFSSMVLNPGAVLKGVPSSQRQTVLTTIGIDSEHAWSYDDFQNRETLELTDPW